MCPCPSTSKHPGLSSPHPLPIFLDSALFSKPFPLFQITGGNLFFPGLPCWQLPSAAGEQTLTWAPGRRFRGSEFPGPLTQRHGLLSLHQAPGQGQGLISLPPPMMGRKTGSEGPAQVPQGGRSEGLVQRSRSWSFGGLLSHQGSFPGVRWPFFPRAPPFVPWSGRD